MAGVLFLRRVMGLPAVLRLPARPAPLSGIAGGGGSLLSFHGAGLRASRVAATGMLAGIMIASPRISRLAAGLTGCC